jgi:hypothetical protein
MLEAMRYFRDKGQLDKAAAIAKDAAPYEHPRKAALTIEGGRQPLEVKLPGIRNSLVVRFSRGTRPQTGHGGSGPAPRRRTSPCRSRQYRHGPPPGPPRRGLRFVVFMAPLRYRSAAEDGRGCRKNRGP